MRKTGSASRLLVVLCAAAAAAGCERQQVQARAYPVTFSSRSDEGEALGDVQIALHGKPLGSTGPRGILRARLRGREGDLLHFDATCPSGYRAPAEPAALRLRSASAPPKASGAVRAPGAELEIVCSAERRTTALLVSAAGLADLPVRVHGRELGRTDDKGFAHLLLEAAPKTPLRVVLDTSSRPNLLPRSPHTDLRVGDHDEIAVFTPELHEVIPKPKPARRKVAPSPPEPKVVRPEQLR